LEKPNIEKNGDRTVGKMFVGHLRAFCQWIMMTMTSLYGVDIEASLQHFDLYASGVEVKASNQVQPQKGN